MTATIMKFHKKIKDATNTILSLQLAISENNLFSHKESCNSEPKYFQ